MEAVKGDLSDLETLEAALQGVASVFLVWPFFAAKGAPAVVKAIVKHARRVVYLPSEGVRDGAREQAQWGQRANAWGSFDFAMAASIAETSFRSSGQTISQEKVREHPSS